MPPPDAAGVSQGIAKTDPARADGAAGPKSQSRPTTLQGYFTKPFRVLVVNDINVIVGSERKAATEFLAAVWGADATGALTPGTSQAGLI